SPVNVLSGIAVTNPGSGYTSAPTVEIGGGGGALALAIARLEGDKVAQILLVSPGVGFTSLPTITLTGGGGSGATARPFHSYGAFGTPSDPVKWILQDMQLDNGVSISNYAILGQTLPVLGEKRPSNATVMRADGTTYWEPSSITPIDHTWTSPATGKTYFPVV